MMMPVLFMLDWVVQSRDCSIVQLSQCMAPQLHGGAIRAGLGQVVRGKSAVYTDHYMTDRESGMRIKI